MTTRASGVFCGAALEPCYLLQVPTHKRPLTLPEIYVPHRPILAKFRLGFWQIVCPGHRDARATGKGKNPTRFKNRITYQLVPVSSWRARPHEKQGRLVNRGQHRYLYPPAGATRALATTPLHGKRIESLGHCFCPNPFRPPPSKANRVA